MASFVQNGFMNMSQNNNNIFSQIQMVRRDPGAILDIMLQSGRINQQQYSELQPYRNDPAKIGAYLMNHGFANEINEISNRLNN